MKKAIDRLKTQDPRLKTLSLMHLICCILYLVSSSYGGSSEEIDYYSPENILKFAEHLYKEGDYLRAAGEYQRYLLYSRQSASSPLWKRRARGDFKHQDTFSTLYKIGLCYRQAGDTRRAISFFRKVVTEHPKSRFSFAASYQIAYSYFFVGQYESSTRYINQALDGTGNSDERGKLHILAGFNYLHQRRWRDAEHILGSVAPKDENLNIMASALRASAREGMSLPHKSPVLAGLLSAVLPGGGKMYCEQYGDGVYSLILVGVTALLAWDGFRESGVRSVRGWLFGSVGGIFYAGNVYGSSVAARIYNRQLEVDLLKHLPAVPDDR